MEEKRMLSSVQKVWLSGTTLVVAIPRRIREVLNIEKGDYVEVDWGDIVKKTTKEVKLKKIEKKVTKEIEEEELPELD